MRKVTFRLIFILRRARQMISRERSTRPVHLNVAAERHSLVRTVMFRFRRAHAGQIDRRLDAFNERRSRRRRSYRASDSRKQQRDAFPICAIVSLGNALSSASLSARDDE